MTTTDNGASAPYEDWPEGIDREHGSTVEQVHRILTTSAYRDMDPWMLAEEIVAFVKVQTAAKGESDQL